MSQSSQLLLRDPPREGGWISAEGGEIGLGSLGSWGGRHLRGVSGLRFIMGVVGGEGPYFRSCSIVTSAMSLEDSYRSLETRYLLPFYCNLLNVIMAVISLRDNTRRKY